MSGSERCRAHPRVCGENQNGLVILAASVGSSPRVRGKPSAWESPKLRSGLIPACAGKTADSLPPRPSLPAHPRVCGENDNPNATSLSGTGSSPRVRGKPRISNTPRGDEGLIPACAGKTSKLRLSEAHLTAHPRVCGENPSPRLSRRRRAGSSPRVRGKLKPLQRG